MELQWRARDGRLYNPKDMTTEHICNALAMLKRNGFIGQSFIHSLLTAQLNGEYAQLAILSAIDEFSSRPVSPFIDIFEAILKEREHEQQPNN